MINKAGREIPEEILKATGKKPFEGAYAYDNYEYKKAAPTVRALSDPKRSKMVDSIREALEKCGLRDNMTLSFHHHFREGDYVLNMVMEEVHRMGVKGITICASSMGKANDAIVPYIEDGTVTGIQSSGVRGKIGQAISSGKLRDLAIMRSHGGRVRAIESGEVHIDIAFIGAPPAMSTETAGQTGERATAACFPMPWWTPSMRTRLWQLQTVWCPSQTFRPAFP